MTSLQLVAYLGLHIAFAWARFAVFRVDGATPRGARLIEVAAVLAIGLGIGLITARADASALLDGLALAVAAASGVLFAWTAATVDRRQLSAAFSPDLPRELIERGPYRWLRHPFYTAYLLSHLHAVLASRSAWALLPLAWMAMIYTVAARREERKFSTSALAASYARYARRTGRFWPRLWPAPDVRFGRGSASDPLQ